MTPWASFTSPGPRWPKALFLWSYLKLSQTVSVFVLLGRVKVHHRKGKETHRFIPFYSVLFMLSQFRRRHSRLSAFSILLRKVRSPLWFQVGRHPEMLFGCEAKLNLFGIFKEETQKAVIAALFYRPTTAEGEQVCSHHFPFVIKRPITLFSAWLITWHIRLCSVPFYFYSIISGWRFCLLFYF